MKIIWETTAYGQVGFRVELHEYDAVPPVDALLMDATPSSTNMEREAVAAYLAFGHWVSGDLQLPHGLGPATARAIEEDLSLVSVHPSPVEYYPKPLEIGVREVVVGFDESFISRPWSITALPSSEWSGALRGLRSLVVPNNAFALDAAASGSFTAFRARLAVAVLFAGDLSADVLVVHPPDVVPDQEKERIRKLLLATRLGVSFVDPHAS